MPNARQALIEQVKKLRQTTNKVAAKSEEKSEVPAKVKKQANQR